MSLEGQQKLQDGSENEIWQLRLESTESQTLEFKSSFGRETIETLVAFANAQGGTVLVGVADDGSVKGVTLSKETLNEWLGQIKSATSPSIIPDIDAITIEGKPVVIICIAEYPVKPVNTKRKYFKRIATSNHQLTLSEITNLDMQSLQLSWDSYEAPRPSKSGWPLQPRQFSRRNLNTLSPVTRHSVRP